MNNFWRFLYVITLFILFTYPNTVHASFGIRLEDDRNSIAHTINAGDGISENIIIINNDEAEKYISIFGADKIKTTSGEYVPGNYDANSRLSSWIGPIINLTLKAQGTYKHNFYIAVPKNAINGIYRGTITVQEKTNSEKDGIIKITSRVSIGITITVVNGNEASSITQQKTEKPLIVSRPIITSPQPTITPPPPPTTIEPSITYSGENVSITVEQKDSSTTTIILLCVISALTLLLIVLLIRKR